MSKSTISILILLDFDGFEINVSKKLKITEKR